MYVQCNIVIGRWLIKPETFDCENHNKESGIDRENSDPNIHLNEIFAQLYVFSR